jgi:hypothetical protein
MENGTPTYGSTIHAGSDRSMQAQIKNRSKK